MSPNTLKAANTLGVSAAAERLVTVRSEAQLEALAAEWRRSGDVSRRSPFTVLGGGSNVVLKRCLPGLVCLVRSRGIRVDRGRRGRFCVTAAAGERWHDLVRFTLGQGLAGLENLALIPGSVGAAPIQNIGAYGVELADRFHSLRALDLTSGRVRVFGRDACRFSYRDSLFKTPEAAGLAILEVTLELSTRETPTIDYLDLQLELARLGWRQPRPVQIAEAVIRVRRRKLPDPRFVGNVGSFFKNPEVASALAESLRRKHPALSARPVGDGRMKLSAAQLIDDCGWKGRHLGPVGVWHRQPLVLVNLGGASGADFLAASEEIRRDVQRRFGVILEREPQVIGQD